MPFPLIPIVVGAAALSVGSTVHSTLKTRKWQKIHNEALANAQVTGERTKRMQQRFNTEAEKLGRLHVSELQTLEEAATFLENAKVKNRDLSPQLAQIPMAQVQLWKQLHGEAMKSLGIGAAGTTGTAAAGVATAAGLYTAAGILGTASTGTAISTLSGAAANSARLAWLGGGALTAGGAGMAGGVATMISAANVVMTPIAIGAAAWGQWKAQRVKREVESKLKEFASFESDMNSRQELLQSALQRVNENRNAVRKAAASLKRSLSTASQHDAQEAYSVYLKAKVLSECLGAPVLSQQQIRQLNRQ